MKWVRNGFKSIQCFQYCLGLNWNHYFTNENSSAIAIYRKRNKLIWHWEVTGMWQRSISIERINLLLFITFHYFEFFKWVVDSVLVKFHVICHSTCDTCVKVLHLWFLLVKFRSKIKEKEWHCILWHDLDHTMHNIIYIFYFITSRCRSHTKSMVDWCIHCGANFVW